MVKALSVLAATAIAACALVYPASAHEGLTTRALSTDERRLFAQSAQSSLTTCTATESSRKLQERAAIRRAETVAKLREEHRQRRLDAATVLATDHKSTTTGITADTKSSTLFTSKTYIVEPEVTEGPYYVKGEYIRSDMRETQSGVKMYVDVQVINVNTCKPVENMYIDLWHTNATGVYSGVVASTNGNSKDASNVNATFLRGVTPTDSDGVAQMISIFPGHYAGRTTHMHFVGTHDGQVLANKTYSGGSVAHVGQFFFDQALITEVEKVAPYSTNTQTVTLNSNDNILSSAAGNGYDPVMNYVKLGSSVSDGLFVWVSLAVDMTAVRTPKAVSTLTGTASTSSNSSNASNSSISSHSSSGSSATVTTTVSNTASSLTVGAFSGVTVGLLAAFAPILLGLLAIL